MPGWAGERLVVRKLRVHPDFIAPAIQDANFGKSFLRPKQGQGAGPGDQLREEEPSR